jgi:hypothetical protein
MSLDDVASLENMLGAIHAEFEEKKPDGSSVVQQARDLESPVLYFTTGVPTGIQLDHHTKFLIYFNGIAVFKTPSRNALAAFEKSEGKAFFGLGAILFPELSVSMNGFCTGRTTAGLPEFWEQAEGSPPNVLNMETARSCDPHIAKYEPISFLDA